MFIRNSTQAVSHRLTASRSAKSQTRRTTRRFYLRNRKRITRYGIVAANVILLAVVTFFVVKSPDSNSSASRSNATISPSSGETAIAGPLDQVSSADIAVHIARTVGLPESNSVVNHADTVSATEAVAPADTSVIAKPQVVSTALASKKDIRTYTVQAGDTLGSIATKFGVSSDSIKWSNSLSGNSVTPGKVLRLPPAGVNGVVYTVARGDTPKSLAQKYTADENQIVSTNDAEISGLTPGDTILIPGGVVQATRVAASNYYTSTFAWGGSTPVYSANGYDYGWCTWHAANRRRETGRPIPSNLGNAISWYYIAKNMGMPVGDTPAAGAVLWHARLGGLGHVAFVESINEDGSLKVSDMNYPIWGRVTYRTVPPSEFGNYKFIY